MSKKVSPKVIKIEKIAEILFPHKAEKAVEFVQRFSPSEEDLSRKDYGDMFPIPGKRNHASLKRALVLLNVLDKNKELHNGSYPRDFRKIVTFPWWNCDETVFKKALGEILKKAA
jgi:hypothetical protein